MSDSGFSPEFQEALAKEIDRMGAMSASLSAVQAMQRAIDGNGALPSGDPLPSVASFKRGSMKRASKPRARKPTKHARARAAISPEQLASRQVQGHYLGLIRQFPKRARGAYQKIAREQSREKAIAAMKRALRGGGDSKATKSKARRRSKPAPAAAVAESPSQES